jgi:hypothetical protein
MRSLSPAERRVLESIAASVVPETAALDEEGRREFLRIVDTALADRSEQVRRRLRLFLFLIAWLPLPRFGRKLTSLPRGARERVLLWLERCPVRVLANGFWGLKAIVFMGYYGQPGVWTELGYAPSSHGNDRLDAHQED